MDFPETNEKNVLFEDETLNKILLDKSNGNKKSYEKLITKISKLNSNKDNRIEILTFINILIDNIYLLNSNTTELVQTTLKLSEWATQSDILADKFREFTCQLITHHIHHLSSSLSMIINLLQYHNQENNNNNNNNNVYSNAHQLLSAIFQLVPTSSRLFVNTLANKYPYKARDVLIHRSLLHNILELSEAYPDLEQELICTVISNLVKMDTDIPRKHLEEILSLSNQKLENNIQITPENLKLHETCTKMDNLLCLIIENIDKNVLHLTKKANINVKRVFQLFSIYFATFQKTILPTPHASHIQYIIFHITTLHPDLSIAFIDNLWGLIPDTRLPSIIRELGICYLSSYLARAKFLKSHLILKTLATISKWLEYYIDSVHLTCQLPSYATHSLFYSVAQMLIYVFIYRHKLILKQKNWNIFVSDLNFSKIIFSKLNPLKICIREIVDLFASIMNHYQILFCFTLIEQNKRNYICDANNSDTLSKKGNYYLLTFFPFDHCILPTLATKINENILQWEEVEPDFLKLQSDNIATQECMEFNNEDNDQIFITIDI